MVYFVHVVISYIEYAVSETGNHRGTRTSESPTLSTLSPTKRSPGNRTIEMGTDIREGASTIGQSEIRLLDGPSSPP